jgi:hypothetical protein
MNLSEVEDYIIELNVGITAEDIQSYNIEFVKTCAVLRECDEIESKEEYTNEELSNYTIKVMSYMYMFSKIDIVKKIFYLLYEGFLCINLDGTLYEEEMEQFVLTDSDFSNVEKQK